MIIVIAAIHQWNIDAAQKLQRSRPNDSINIVTQNDELTSRFLADVNPDYIFFPHWSWHIPPEIFDRFRCVVFHMTDLPFGRGGSPLQNLIARGVTHTQISAIRVCAGIDTGDIYIKRPLSLHGGAEEIFIRTAGIIFGDMIPYIIDNDPVPEPQTGEPVTFRRRTPEMSELSPDMTLGEMFDYIRMLDAEGYPRAFIRFGGYKLAFSRPKRTYSGIVADVIIKRDAADEKD